MKAYKIMFVFVTVMFLVSPLIMAEDQAVSGDDNTPAITLDTPNGGESSDMSNKSENDAQNNQPDISKATFVPKSASNVEIPVGVPGKIVVEGTAK